MPDPGNPQAYNRYSYVENRPLIFTDPSGHIACDSSNLPGMDQGACVHDTQQAIDNNDSYYPQASRVANAIIGVGKGDVLPKEYAHYDNSKAWETYARTAVEPIDWFLTGKEMFSGEVSPLEGAQLVLLTIVLHGGLADEGAGFVDDFLSKISPSSRPGTRSFIGEVSGNLDEAETMFHNLVVKDTVEWLPDQNRFRGFTSDGYEIGFRPVTSSGSPAIDLHSLYNAGLSDYKYVHVNP